MLATSPFSELILNRIVEIQHRTGRPVKTTTLSTHLNKPPRTMRWHLRNLEEAGLLARPAGPKSGYAICSPGYAFSYA
ncbi:Rrf2 family transcriptional regulator [Phototrophicus methaneseepsis]|uniref:Rrf2 family transcriptional regulator n=1 Tax=Phototrophicus methaneseepsis TaxID=2710758 RepID=A0A7S8EB83_9CHLR|nr:helix-turn-helix domain-containing protein [Phototrophicus methaneseepsis]QPC83766.1 Rrf2 family transcriptional regulator [Phototrophicus methaneseepsis]